MKLIRLLVTDPAKLAEEMREHGSASIPPSIGRPGVVRDLSLVEVMRHRKDYGPS